MTISLPPYTGDTDLDYFNSEIARQINSGELAAGGTSDVETGEDNQSYPTVGGLRFGYQQRFIHTRYGTSNIGADFTDDYTDISGLTVFQGLRNSSSPTESTNPAEYTWREINVTSGWTPAFRLIGGRLVDWEFLPSVPTGYTRDVAGTIIDLDNLGDVIAPATTGAVFPSLPVFGQEHYLTAVVGDNDPGWYKWNGLEWIATSGASTVNNTIVDGNNPATLASNAFVFLQAVDQGVWPGDTYTYTTTFTNSGTVVAMAVVSATVSNGLVTLVETSVDTNITITFTNNGTGIASVFAKHSSGAASSYDVLAIPSAADGAPGLTTAINFAYADDINGGGFSLTDTTKSFRGTDAVTYPTGGTPPATSTTPGDYEWQQWTGNSGQSVDIYRAFANTPDGSGSTFSLTYFSNALYEGTDVVSWAAPATKPAQSTNPSSYEWTRTRGEDGMSVVGPAATRVVSRTVYYNDTDNQNTVPSGDINSIYSFGNNTFTGIATDVVDNGWTTFQPAAQSDGTATYYQGTITWLETTNSDGLRTGVSAETDVVNISRGILFDAVTTFVNTASTQATNAANSATNASNSATEASNSATAAANSATTAASNAQAANNTRRVFYQNSTPNALAAENIWFDTNDGNKIYVSTAAGTGNWVQRTITANQATALVNAGTTTINGGRIETGSVVAGSVDSAWVYTGSLTAAQVNAVDITADAISAGNISSTTGGAPTGSQQGINLNSSGAFTMGNASTYIRKTASGNVTLAGELVTEANVTAGVMINATAGAITSGNSGVFTNTFTTGSYPATLIINGTGVISRTPNAQGALTSSFRLANGSSQIAINSISYSSGWQDIVKLASDLRTAFDNIGSNFNAVNESFESINEIFETVDDDLTTIDNWAGDIEDWTDDVARALENNGNEIDGLGGRGERGPRNRVNAPNISTISTFSLGIFSDIDDQLDTDFPTSYVGPALSATIPISTVFTAAANTTYTFNWSGGPGDILQNVSWNIIEIKR